MVISITNQPNRRLLYDYIEFASVGIGVHHAGLTLDDRQEIERLYLGKVLRILIATSVRVVFEF